METDEIYFNVKKYGAAGDGKKDDTAAVSEAIRICADGGGGTVYIPPGKYVCGTLMMKSNVNLYIASGAEIIYHPDEENFNEPDDTELDRFCDFETAVFSFSLIYARDLRDFSITGGGKIVNRTYPRGGPKPLGIKNCSNFVISGITIENSPNYAVSLSECTDFLIDGIKIVNGYADGIDLDNCSFGTVRDCNINTFDDGICLKTSTATRLRKGTDNITVYGCRVASSCNALKLGTESNWDFTDIIFSGCTVYPRPKGKRDALAAVALETVDGGNISGVIIGEITVSGAHSPLFIRRGFRNRGKTAESPGIIDNIIIHNMVVRNAAYPCIIAGIPDYPVGTVRIENLYSEYSALRKNPKGNIKKTEPPLKPDPRKGYGLPEKIEAYPEVDMFGTPPSYAFYVRHAENVFLENIVLKFGKEITEENGRLPPAAVFEDCSYIVSDRWTIKKAPPQARENIIELYGVNNIRKTGIFPPKIGKNKEKPNLKGPLF